MSAARPGRFVASEMLGVGVRDVIGVLREAQRGPVDIGPIVVSGTGAADVVAALCDGGNGSLVALDGDPAGAAALVRIVDGAVGLSDEQQLRRGARAGIPLVALVRDPAADRIPYVLATDVVDWAAGEPLPLGRLAAALADGLRDDAVRFAAGLPALRDAVVGRQAHDAALSAAMLGLLRSGRGPLTPVISLLQARMLRRVEVARGVAPPAQPQGVAAAAGPELAAALATGAACRTLVRSLPLRGRVVDAAVAYGGTLALASVAGRMPRRR
jgi:uncharacterized protein (DUF697 family)